MIMHHLPNLLSFLRVPLALCLFISFPLVRFFSILLAMITDIVDGWVARRYGYTSRIGTIIDPLTDKFFVITAVAIFFYEGALNWQQLLAFFSRDIALLFFSSTLWYVDGWKKFTIRAFYCGKIVTTLQFITLLILSLQLVVPKIFFYSMAIFGTFSYLELLCIYKKL